MSETITGQVSAKRKDGKGVQINGQWYSSRSDAFFTGVKKGDTITLSFTRNGTWLNCDEATPPVVTSAAAAGGSKQGGRASGFRDPDEIVRGESLKVALEFLVATNGFAGSPGYGESVEKLLKTSDLFSNYSKGLIDLKQSAPAVAPPAPEVQTTAPAPEPAPAAAAPATPEAQAPVAGSALANFLG
jgi:hypothetical protein